MININPRKARGKCTFFLKPKKKSGFASRLEEAMKQQQAVQEQKKKK